MNTPQDLFYTKEHEWLRIADGKATVGITDFAQGELGDVVFVELPEVGAQLSQGDNSGVVESVKAASEIYSPVSGEIVDANSLLEDAPDTVNSDPTGDGWFFKIKLSDASELDGLMDEATYKAFAGKQG